MGEITHPGLGIRGRVLALGLGVGVPLALAGAAALASLWNTSRAQLEASVVQQAQLAAVALERWLDAQRQPVSAVAAHVASAGPDAVRMADNLRAIATTRDHWMDLRILDRSGALVVAYPPDPGPLPQAVADTLSAAMRRRGTWAMAKYWTPDVPRAVLAVASPVDGGGHVVARIDSAAMEGVFRGVHLDPGAAIAVFDDHGRVLHAHALPADDAAARGLGTLVREIDATPRRVMESGAPDGTRRIYAAVHGGASGCTVILGVPSDTLFGPARDQLRRYAAMAVLALGVAVAAALVIGGRIARPLEDLTTVVRRFGGGDLEARAPEASDGEVGALGRTFNRMAALLSEREDRLREKDRLKSDFVSGVSHELRTPLTTIKTLVHVLRSDGLDGDERRASLDTIDAECDRQIELVLNLLDLSQIEAGTLAVQREPVDVAAVVTAVAGGRGPTTEGGRARIEAHVEPALPLAWADSAVLRRVVSILIDNAVKYGPADGVIRVEAAQDGGNIVVSVSDSGPGIAPEDLPRVFDRYYRAAATSRAPGLGLGLYLARLLVERIGGRIDVESVPGDGTTFAVRVPADRDAGDHEDADA